ncbi:hypothetical protein BD413DRAFT_268594 [Trametes elegans]|nr:hypothetical protein BD413DRAFT_268594 [Trametes elegans]
MRYIRSLPAWHLAQISPLSVHLRTQTRVMDRVFSSGPSAPKDRSQVITLAWTVHNTARKGAARQPPLSPSSSPRRARPPSPISCSFHTRRVPFMMFLPRSLWMCNVMPSDPPSPARPQRPTTPRTQTSPAPPSPLTPAQAIAQAWMRESPEAQQRWRRADEEAKERYHNPIRWNTAGRSPGRKTGGKL